MKNTIYTALSYSIVAVFALIYVQLKLLYFFHINRTFPSFENWYNSRKSWEQFANIIFGWIVVIILILVGWKIALIILIGSALLNLGSFIYLRLKQRKR